MDERPEGYLRIFIGCPEFEAYERFSAIFERNIEERCSKSKDIETLYRRVMGVFAH